MAKRRHEDARTAARRHHRLAKTQVLRGHGDVGKKLVLVDEAHRDGAPAKVELVHDGALQLGIVPVKLGVDRLGARLVREGVIRCVPLAFNGERTLGTVARARSAPHAVVDVRREGIALLVRLEHIAGAKRDAQAALHAARRIVCHRINSLARVVGGVPQRDLILSVHVRYRNSSLHQGGYTRRPEESVRWYEQNGMARPSGTVTIMEHSRKRCVSMEMASM